MAQAGVAGSSRVGDSTVIGAQAGISDHVSVTPGVRIGAQAGVLDDLDPGDWMGSPAMPAARARRVLAVMSRLPEIYDELRSLRRRCEALEKQAGTGGGLQPVGHEQLTDSRLRHHRPMHFVSKRPGFVFGYSVTSRCALPCRADFVLDQGVGRRVRSASSRMPWSGCRFTVHSPR